jgi:hypothetical protein
MDHGYYGKFDTKLPLFKHLNMKKGRPQQGVGSSFDPWKTLSVQA